MDTTLYANVNKPSRISNIVTSILFYLAKKWNKHNSFFNAWMRSSKDMSAHGPCKVAVVDMSKDGRARIRYNAWVFYVGYSDRKTKQTK